MVKRRKSEGRNIIMNEGERGLIVGSTGSGKSGLAAWILRRLPFFPIWIYDTKNEDKFDHMPGAVIVESFDAGKIAMQEGEPHYVVFRPPVEELAEPSVLDNYLMRHYFELPDTMAYVDEATMFHNNGRHGPGLLALLTRGRSNGNTLLMGSQRPVGMSMFAKTEAQHFYIMALAHDDDRKSIGKIVRGFEHTADPQRYGFHYFKIGDQSPTLFNPVSLDPGLDNGYIQVQDEVAQDVGVPQVVGRHVWF